jgi:hypothetical protein
MEVLMDSEKEKIQPDPNKEPIFTGHSSHAEFMENLRIGAASKGFGHGIALLFQVAVYLAILIGLVFAVWWVFAR